MATPHDDTGELTPPVPHYLSITSRILDSIAWLCMLLAGIALVVIIVTFGWLVYGRYILDNTPTWVEQLSILLIAYITFLGAAVGVRRNTHLSIDFIRESLPPHPRLVLRYVSNLMVLAFGVGMAWQGWILAMQDIDRAIPMLDMPETWRDLPMIICGVLIVVFSIYDIVARFAGANKSGG